MASARKIKLTLGVGVAVIAAVGALTLTRSPPRIVRVAARANQLVGDATSDVSLCQANEVLPAGASAIRLTLAAYYGARIRVKAFSGSRVLTEGSRGPDWTGTSVTVPLTPLKRASLVKLCIYVGPNSETIYFLGTPTPPQESAISSKGRVLGNRVGAEYLAAGRGSWWSRILTVARHTGIGRDPSGTWVVLLIAALVGAVGVLALQLVLREAP